MADRELGVTKRKPVHELEKVRGNFFRSFLYIRYIHVSKRVHFARATVASVAKMLIYPGIKLPEQKDIVILIIEQLHCLRKQV